MSRFEKFAGILCIILSIFIVGTFLYAVGQAVYEHIYNMGVKHGYSTMRVTSIKEDEAVYTVFIRDMNDDLYMHTVNK